MQTGPKFLEADVLGHKPTDVCMGLTLWFSGNGGGTSRQEQTVWRIHSLKGVTYMTTEMPGSQP